MGGRHLHAEHVRAAADAGRGADQPCQGLDNSDPQASNATFNTTEDSCVALPSLAGHITDWDVTGLPARSQPLSARLTSLPACASGGGSGCGDFYSDSSCTNRITAASALADLEPDAVYYKGAPNAYSYAEDGSTVGVQGSEGVYALVEWEASDNNTGTDTATLHIRVASVNDAPIAWDYTTPTVAGANPSPVYMDLPYSIYVNGTDVDGADPADPIAECSIEITSLPSHGTLRAEQADGTPYGAISSWAPWCPPTTSATGPFTLRTRPAIASSRRTRSGSSWSTRSARNLSARAR